MGTDVGVVEGRQVAWGQWTSCGFQGSDDAAADVFAAVLTFVGRGEFVRRGGDVRIVSVRLWGMG